MALQRQRLALLDATFTRATQSAACIQGFCCDCTSAQVWQETVGQAQQRTRAGLNCDYFANPYLPIFGSPPGSAHCLVYQSEWCAPAMLRAAGNCADVSVSLMILQACDMTKIVAATITQCLIDMCVHTAARASCKTVLYSHLYWAALAHIVGSWH